MQHDVPVTIELDHAAADSHRILGGSFQVEVIAPDIIFGEGPIWDRQEKRLSFVDIVGEAIGRVKPGGKPGASRTPVRR